MKVRLTRNEKKVISAIYSAAIARQKAEEEQKKAEKEMREYLRYMRSYEYRLDREYSYKENLDDIISRLDIEKEV